MKKTNEKGITLIALIITVIIMIILAGVTLDIVIERRLVKEAKNSVDKVKQHQDTMSSIREEVRNQIKPSDT